MLILTEALLTPGMVGIIYNAILVHSQSATYMFISNMSNKTTVLTEKRRDIKMISLWYQGVAGP